MTDAFYSDEDEKEEEEDEEEKMFKKNLSKSESENEEEEDPEKMKISKLFLNKLYQNEEKQNDFSFKDNQDLEKLLEKKNMEKLRENERLERENQKKVRKIMKNAIEYINFIKAYILLRLCQQIKSGRLIFSETLKSYVMSKYNLTEILEMDKLALNYEKKDRIFENLMRSLFKIHSRRFVFKKFNSFYLLYNFAHTNNYTHKQTLFIFAALLSYCKIPVRFVEIMELKGLNLDRKFKMTTSLIQKSSSKKRRPNQEPISKNLKKTKYQTFNEAVSTSIRNMIEKDINVKSVPFEKEEEEEKELTEEKDNNDQIDDLDDFLKEFKFKQTNKPIKAENLGEELPFALKGKVPANLDDEDDNLMNINTFNFENIRKPEEKRVRRQFNDEYESEEFKYWLEVYDYETKNWVIVNPILQEIHRDTRQQYIFEKINGNPVLFITALQHIENPIYKTSCAYKPQEIFLTDITARYVEKWGKVLSNRRQLNILKWYDDLVCLLDPTKLLELSSFDKEIFENEKRYLDLLFKQEIPTNYLEFRYSPHYILPSHLKKYQGLKPDAKPIGLKFKDEDIYERTNVVELHTKTRWLRMMRRIKPGEVCIKKVLALTNDGEKLADLYGEWQTEEFINELTPEGELPKNQYGNYELLNGAPPAGTIHIDLPFVAKICKKIEIKYVETVVGFERTKGRCHAVKSGVLIFEEDREKVLKNYEEYAKEMMQKQKETERKNILTLWRKLFKGILVRKYLKDSFDNI